MVSANGVYRLSSSPLFRCMSWRRHSSKLFVGGNKNRDVNALFVKIYVYCFSNMVHSRIHLSKVGLSYDTNEPVLKDSFGQHGEIIEVKVICDHKSGKSKGYGFVHFMSEDSASKALVEMNGQLLDSRNIRIQYANKK